MSASAFSLSAIIPIDGFALVAGEPVIGGLHGASRHHFCPSCLTWMYTNPERLESFVNVRSTMFADPAPFAPFVETCTAEKLPFAQTNAPHRYPSFPAPEEFGRLTQEYVGWAEALRA